ncbi:MAG: YhbY family RNA-binding protein [Ruminococcaceae bacterium]|nr:YhbY family RNA-binding protein [Oscillospiraceae bacterium]
MELTSKQRAQLRGLANTMDTILQVGKDGINENLVKQLDDALEARELVKCRVLENAMLTAREACQELCVLTRSEPVQVIGTKFVLYRTSHTIPREKRIELVTAGQKKTVKAVPKTAKTGTKSSKPAGKSAARKPAARKSGKK